MIRKITILALSLGLLCLASLFGFYLYNQTIPIPEPKWDNSSESIVLVIDRFRGEVVCDYLPPLQIQGNGRALRVFYEEGNRYVLETILPEQDMQRVINDFIQADFFDNDTRYDSFPTTGQYVMLSLKNNITHWVVLEENEAVKLLAEQLVSDIEENGQDYTPSEGVIRVYQVEHQIDANEVVQTWPDEKFGYSLDEVTLQSPV